MDWLKVEKSTPDKPEILQIAGALGVDPDRVFGALFRVWSYYDTHTTDGNAAGVTVEFIEERARLPGLVRAMIDAGWLANDSGRICVVNFCRHMGQSAKTRAVTAERVKKSRDKSKAGCNGRGVTDVTVEALPDKIRSDIPPVVPPSGGTRWPDDLDTEVGKAVRAIWYPDAATASHVRTVRRLVSEFEALGADPGDIEERHGVAVQEYGERKATAAAVLRQWANLKPKPSPVRICLPEWWIGDPDFVDWCRLYASELAGVGDEDARFYLFLTVEGKRGRWANEPSRATSAREYWHVLNRKFGALEGDVNACAGYLRAAFRKLEDAGADVVASNLFDRGAE